MLLTIITSVLFSAATASLVALLVKKGPRGDTGPEGAPGKDAVQWDSWSVEEGVLEKDAESFREMIQKAVEAEVSRKLDPTREKPSV